MALVDMAAASPEEPREQKRRVRLAPSIISADLTRLGAEIERISGVADWAHVDVTDNHFVPTLTFGLPMVEALAQRTALPLDCHLAVADPDRWAPRYAEAGAGSVTIHVEAARTPVQTLRAIRAAGARAALALNPATPLEPYEELLDEADTLMLMTIYTPGFSGQGFLDGVLPKLRLAREIVDRRGLELWLQVDGGVNAETIERCAEAGADVFTVGSAAFGAADPAAALRGLRDKARRACRPAAALGAEALAAGAR